MKKRWSNITKSLTDGAVNIIYCHQVMLQVSTQDILTYELQQQWSRKGGLPCLKRNLLFFFSVVNREFWVKALKYFKYYITFHGHLRALISRTFLCNSNRSLFEFRKRRKSPRMDIFPTFVALLLSLIVLANAQDGQF